MLISSIIQSGSGSINFNSSHNKCLNKAISRHWLSITIWVNRVIFFNCAMQMADLSELFTTYGQGCTCKMFVYDRLTVKRIRTMTKGQLGCSACRCINVIDEPLDSMTSCLLITIVCVS